MGRVPWESKDLLSLVPKSTPVLDQFVDLFEIKENTVRSHQLAT